MSKRPLNVRHLRAFAEVMRCGSITRACARVHLSQPAITQAVAKLEEQIGAQLFERRSEGMAATAAGGILHARVERAQRLMLGGAREVARQRQRASGQKGFANFEQLATSAQLRALVAVSKAQNFSLAARAEGISQPSLYRAARDLERLAGVDLFVKTGEGIELTDAGATLARAIRLAFVELEQGIAEIDALRGIDSGHVTIGSTPLPRSFLLPTAIDAFLARRPTQRVSVVDGPYDDLLGGLRHGEIDIMVGALRVAIGVDDVVQKALFLDPLAVVGRRGHPLGRARRIDAAALARYPWVIPRRGTPTRDFFEQMFEGAEQPASIVEASSLVLARELLRQSDRLTLISAHQVRREVEMGMLAPLPLDLPQTARPIGLTLRRDWSPTQSQQAFIDCLQRAAEGEVASSRTVDVARVGIQQSNGRSSA